MKTHPSPEGVKESLVMTTTVVYLQGHTDDNLCSPE